MRQCAGGESLIELDDFVHEYFEREAVADQMMQRDGQQMFIRRSAEQLCAHQAVGGDVERAACGLLGERVSRLEGEPAPVDELDLGGVGSRDLRGFAVHFDEPRAKDLVPALDFGPGARQRGCVERPSDSHGGREVVRRAGAAKLLEEPEALLREGERALRRAVFEHDGLCRRAVGWRGPQEFDDFGFAGLERTGQFSGEDVTRGRETQVAVFFPDPDVRLP